MVGKLVVGSGLSSLVLAIAARLSRDVISTGHDPEWA
jgi:hypothetical protein